MTIGAVAEFDFNVAGAGSADCVLADQLSACCRHSILVLGAGGWGAVAHYFKRLAKAEFRHASTRSGRSCAKHHILLTGPKKAAGTDPLNVSPAPCC
jgi:choline dehydrogenase-like flavoprotein